MMNNKLELTWVGKYDYQKIEPRLLIEDKTKSYGDQNAANILIHGDNLLALKALEKDYSGKIKCIYIDPPYNTGSAFEYYDDNLEHSIWLNLMVGRLKILKNLLSDDGVILVQIDDNEQAYLKIVMDEIFGRNNFINSISVKSSTPSGLKTAHREKTIIKTKDYILVYKKNNIVINPQYQEADEWDTHFNYYFDKEKMEVKSLKDVICDAGIYPNNISANKFSLSNKDFYDFVLKNSDKIFQTGKSMPEKVREISLKSENKNKPIPYNEGGNSIQYAYNGRRMSFLSSSVHYISNKGKQGVAKLVCDFWNDIDFNNSQNEGGVSFPASKKPEILIHRILNMFTNEGDLVLDSFLGSGTTAAVAHKMNRKWIGIEMGNHCYSHCIPRLNKVIDGIDTNGITSLVNWGGGGGYKFYELAPTLIKNDSFGEEIINKEYNNEMLAEAVALHENFKYCPDKECFWKQSIGTESSYLYVTTDFVNKILLDNINNTMKDNEFLIIECTSYDADIIKKYKNIEIKKIPECLLSKCKFDVDNYNLNIVSTKEMEEESD